MTRSPAADLDTAAAVLARRCARTAAGRRRGGREAAGGGGLGGDALGRLPGGGGHGVGPRRDRDAGRRTRRPADRGVLGDRVRRRDRAPDRGRQGLPRRGRRAPLPAGPGLVPGGQGRPARVAGPPDRPRDPGPVAGGRRVRRPPRRARRAQGPPRPGRPAGRGGDRAVHARGGRTPPPPGRRRPVLHRRHPAALAARAPAPCTGSSTSPTPSTSTPPSPPGRRR